MSHIFVLGRQMRELVSVLYLGLFIIFAGMIYYATETFNPMITGGFAAAGTGFVILRALTPIKDMYAKARMREAEDQARLEEEHEAERIREFGLACVEIAKMMSRLSDADLSVFITADQVLTKEQNTYRFMTSRGSPNHHVLVAMTDVGAANPVEMRRIAPGTEASLATYKLTPWGQHILARFIGDALHYRGQSSGAT